MIHRHEGTHALLTVGGIGHMTPASGTWGSIPPVLLAYGLAVGGFGPGTWVWHAVLIGVVLVFGLGCALLGDEGEAWWGKDPSPVVADEVAGMALTLALIPAAPEGSGVPILMGVAGGMLLWVMASNVLKPMFALIVGALGGAAAAALALALIPAAPGWIGWWLIAAFLLFRAADIKKPWPADGLQSLPGGWGIVLDDLAAAVHAAVPLIVVALLLSS